MYYKIAIIAAFAFIFSIMAGKIKLYPISGPIIFTLFGFLSSPYGFDFLPLEHSRNVLMELAEVTLALVLFTDAASADSNSVKKYAAIPTRMLLIGLPITIALGVLAGWLVFDTLTLIEIAILSTILAPTDAALGQAVVSDKNVPERLRVGLNVESGLNDGICVPILFIFLALAQGQQSESTQSLIFSLVTEEIGIGALVGMTLAFMGAKILYAIRDKDWINQSWQQVPLIALSLLCFATAQLWGGSGFIACFTGGLVFGYFCRKQKHRVLQGAEGTGDMLALLTWIVFGSLAIGPAVAAFSWQIILYALLSLTILRIVPVYLSIVGMGLSNYDKSFLSWFGPRGLASIVFMFIMLQEGLPNQGIIAATVVFTICLSIVAHGISALPMAAHFKSKPSLEQK